MSVDLDRLEALEQRCAGLSEENQRLRIEAAKDAKTIKEMADAACQHRFVLVVLSSEGLTVSGPYTLEAAESVQNVRGGTVFPLWE